MAPSLTRTQKEKEALGQGLAPKLATTLIHAQFTPQRHHWTLPGTNEDAPFHPEGNGTSKPVELVRNLLFYQTPRPTPACTPAVQAKKACRVIVREHNIMQIVRGLDNMLLDALTVAFITWRSTCIPRVGAM